jgi:DNA-binding transcriptional MerR regulator
MRTNEPSLTLAEVLERANALREKLPELADTDPFTERTFYYYVQQGLLPRASRRRGPGTTYPAHFVPRLLFIRRLQKEESLTLSHIRGILERVDSRTLEEVAFGRENVEVQLYASPETVAARRLGGERVMHLQANGRVDEIGEDEAERAVFASGDEPVAATKQNVAPPQQVWRYPAGPLATLEVRKKPTKLQNKRLEKVLDLVRSILDDDE